MQQLVGYDIGSYTFDPDHGNIAFIGVSPTLAQILLVVNKTVGNQLLYTHLGTPGQSGSLSGAVLHLASACHGMHSTDVLQIYIDIPVAVTPIGGTVVAEGYVWDTNLLDWVPMQQPILNAGSVTIPGAISISSSALPIGAATETTLQKVAGMNYDNVSVDTSGGSTIIITKKLGAVTVDVKTVNIT